MKSVAMCLAAAAAATLVAAQPAVASPPASRACQPTFQPVVGLAAAIAFAEAAFGRPLTAAELDMITHVVATVDRNGDRTLCVKLAADSPGLAVPLLQAIDNQLPAS